MYVVGELLSSMDCPFPQAEAWPSSAAEQCTARSSRHHAPASSPHPPLGTDALLGRLLQQGLAQELRTPLQHVERCPDPQPHPAPKGFTPSLTANSGVLCSWLPGSGGTERIGPEMVMAMSLSAPPHLPDPMLQCLSRKAGHNAQIIND